MTEDLDRYIRRLEAEQAAKQAQIDHDMAAYKARLSPDARRAFEAREAEREAQRKQAADDEERELEPIKAERRRAWLIANPGSTAFEFDYKIWPLVRQEYASFEAKMKREIQAMRQHPRYRGV